MRRRRMMRPVGFGVLSFDDGLRATTVEMAADRAVGPTFGPSLPVQLRHPPSVTKEGLRFSFEVTGEAGCPPNQELVVSALRYAALGYAFRAPIEVGEDSWRASVAEPPGRNERKGYFEAWALGLCPNVDRVTRQVLRSEKMQRLADLTGRGQMTVSGFSQRKNPGPRESKFYEWRAKMTSADIEEALSVLQSISVIQALAGRGKKGQADAWVGRPVADLVEQIFEDHLYRLVKNRQYEVAQQARLQAEPEGPT